MAARLRLRFRTKIWIALCGLVGVALAVALAVAQDAALERVRSESRARFDRTLTAFHELQRLRAQYASAEIDALSRANPQLRTILSTASLAAADLGFGGAAPEDALHDANLRLQSALPSLAAKEKLVVFALTDAHGRLLYSRADPERFGQDLLALGRVKSVADGARATWIWLDGDAVVGDARLAPAYPSPALYLVRGEPVVFDDEVHGIVLLGEPLDRELLESLRGITGVDLALVSRGRVIATTLSAAHEGALPVALERMERARDPGRGMAELQLDDERFLALRSELDPGTPQADAGFVLLTSLSGELAAFRELRTTLSGVGLLVLAGALGVGYALARGITNPLSDLGRAARRVGRGDLDARVSIATGDELESLGDAFNEMAAGLRERELIKSTLERYVSKKVAAELLRDPGRVTLAGARRELTVMFVDLGGFTALAEELPPEVVVAHLNEYFEAVCGAVLEEDGTVKEFQGDGVVAFWGAPIPQPDHAPRACRAALAAAARLDALRGRWERRGVIAPSYRLGLHSAELVAGEIGSAERGAYGIVGDGMNLAARIEGANKLYGTRLLVSEATRERLGAGFLLRELDRVRVVGRRQPVRLFELIAQDSAATPQARRACALYERALAAYRARAFGESLRALDELLAAAPDDAPARFLRARVSELESSPPPADWDAVLALETK
ncbi:MAG TPA: adenylate/guanylate cyclase domain-containing protein [Myxococcota bacterium]|nr:adenylate/guanylate cyclase domain-containing protein [Myxococcota bacterium]